MLMVFERAVRVVRAPFIFVVVAFLTVAWFGLGGIVIVRYGPLEMEPAATVLNYGQSIFEGLKSTRADDGSIVCFRPDMNAKRIQDGCDHYVMPKPSTEVGGR